MGCPNFFPLYLWLPLLSLTLYFCCFVLVPVTTQPQGMLQVLLNPLVFRMDIQNSIEAPRFSSHSHPNSFEPHECKPGRLSIEEGIDPKVGLSLGRLGHDIEWLPPRSDSVAGVCAISANIKTGLITGGADPRRSGRAMGW